MMFPRCLPLLALLSPALNAQLCLTLSTVRAAPDGTANLELSLASSPLDQPPAALQWTLQFPTSVRSLTMDDGPAVIATGKTVICAPSADGYTCLVVGANARTIAEGVIARISAVLAPEATTSAIQVLNPLAASSQGYFIPVSARGGLITTGNVSMDRRLRPPLRRIAGIRCGSAQ